MCLPLKFVKLVAKTISYTLLVAALTLLIVGLLAQSKITSIMALICCGYLVLLAICAGLGQRIKSCCLLGCFNICFFLFILFVALITYIMSIYSGNTDAIEFQFSMLVAQQHFCQNECPCYIDPNTKWPTQTYLLDNQLNYTENNNDPINFQSCPQVIENYDYYKSIEQIEWKYNCSGIFSQSPIYLFSDVNRGVPQTDCEIYIIGNLSQGSIVLNTIFEIVDAAMIFLLIMSFCLCCHPQQKYEQMYPPIKYEIFYKFETNSDTEIAL